MHPIDAHPASPLQCMDENCNEIKENRKNMNKKFIASNNNDLKFSKRKQTQKNIYTVDEFRSEFTKESDLQRLCNEYLDLMKINYIRIPDELYFIIFGNRNTPAWIKRIISKYIKGIPDLLIFKKGKNKENVCLWVELKSKQGKLSQGQINRGKNLNLIIIKSFEDFKKIIDDFITIN